MVPGRRISNSYTSYFKQVKLPETNGWYCQTQYELHDFTTTRYSSAVRNILARLKSILVLAIMERKVFPKAIIVVPDDDIIKQSKIPKHEIREGEYKNVLKYLMEEFHRITAGYLDKLPTKAKEEFFRHIIWIAPPQHKYFSNNYEREQFTAAMEATVELYPNMAVLRLKKVWEENEGNLYMREQRRYTQAGYYSYWKSVDAALRFWDKTLKEIMLKKQKKQPLAEIMCHPKHNLNSTNSSQTTTSDMKHSNYHRNNKPSTHRAHHRSPTVSRRSRYTWHKDNFREIWEG